MILDDSASTVYFCVMLSRNLFAFSSKLSGGKATAGFIPQQPVASFGWYTIAKHDSAVHVHADAIANAAVNSRTYPANMDRPHESLEWYSPRCVPYYGSSSKTSCPVAQLRIRSSSEHFQVGFTSAAFGFFARHARISRIVRR